MVTDNAIPAKLLEQKRAIPVLPSLHRSTRLKVRRIKFPTGRAAWAVARKVPLSLHAGARRCHLTGIPCQHMAVSTGRPARAAKLSAGPTLVNNHGEAAPAPPGVLVGCFFCRLHRQSASVSSLHFCVCHGTMVPGTKPTVTWLVRASNPGLNLRYVASFWLPTPHRAHPRRPSAAGVVPLPLAPD